MSSATLKAQGNEHYSKQEWEKAIECYTKAIELEKDLVKTAPLLSNRVAAYLNVGDLVRGELLLHRCYNAQATADPSGSTAGEDAHQSIVRDKHYAKGWARKAEVDLKRGKNELAETTCESSFWVPVLRVAADKARLDNRAISVSTSRLRAATEQLSEEFRNQQSQQPTRQSAEQHSEDSAIHRSKMLGP
jgi:tetratricopeptide (TPR) repeat protein